MSEDDDFIPYLVLVCFDRGTDLRDRIVTLDDGRIVENPAAAAAAH